MRLVSWRAGGEGALTTVGVALALARLVTGVRRASLAGGRYGAYVATLVGVGVGVGVGASAGAMGCRWVVGVEAMVVVGVEAVVVGKEEMTWQPWNHGY